MKKKLLFSTVIAIFALGVIGTISVSKTVATDLLFANVEALANDEGDNRFINEARPTVQTPAKDQHGCNVTIHTTEVICRAGGNERCNASITSFVTGCTR